MKKYPQPQGHLYGLDLLRVIAAVMVMLNHFALFGWREANGFAYGSDAAFPMINLFGGTGAIGVQIFFVISGFVIALSATGTQAGQFARSRAIRILPTLWICATIALAARALYGEPLSQLVPDYLRSIILSPKGPYIDGVVWTLVVEAVFYAVVCASIAPRSSITLNHIAIGMGAASGLFIIVFSLSSGANNTALYDVLNGFLFKVILLRYGVFFSIGMVVFSIYYIGPARWKNIALVAFTIFALIEISISAGSLQASIARTIIWIGGLGAIIASIRYALKINELLGQHKTFCRNLGRLSYPLYLNHYAVGIVLVPTLFAVGFQAYAALIMTLLIIVSASWWITAVPERAIQQRLRAAVEGWLRSSSTKRGYKT